MPKLVKDLPKNSQYLLATAVFLMSFVKSALGDDLHNKWWGALFQTKDANQIPFGVQFDPNTFPNANATVKLIMEKCSELIEIVQPDWWDDVSIDWQSIQKFCNTGVYKTQAEAFMTLSQSVIDYLANVSVPETVWNCLNEAVDSSCQKGFFDDWKLGYQILFVAGLASVGAALTFGLYKGYKYAQGFWNRRNYDPINDSKDNLKKVEVESQQTAEILSSSIQNQ